MSASLRNIGPLMLVGAGKMGLALAKGWLEAGLPRTARFMKSSSAGPYRSTRLMAMPSGRPTTSATTVQTKIIEMVFMVSSHMPK